MIHILYTDISGLGPDAYERLYAQASSERKARADRYRRPGDKLRCVTAEALLRRALGTDRYTLETGPQGKPRITGRPDFHFNLSHSGRYAVVAYGGSPVGVDVEKIREDTDIDAIAARFFSSEEQAYIRKSPEESRLRFFEIWTKKESYVKYLGTGLTKSLATFSVLHPEPGMRFRHRQLPGGYCLSLYGREGECVFEQTDILVSHTDP